MLVIILSATWLRFWRLAELPPGFYYDEAYNALDGLWMFKTMTPVAYFVGNTGRHPMIGYLAGLAMMIWGVSVSPRTASCTMRIPPSCSPQ